MEKRHAVEMKIEGRKLVGYAAVFNQETRIADFHERIAPGAFKNSLASNGDILALVDHDPTKVLARTKSGTLSLSEDERGLRFELSVPETTLGRDLLEMAKRSDLGGMSFGFHVPDGGDVWTGDRRELRNVALHEVSVINSVPAYAGTTVQARSRASLTRTANERRIALLELESAHVAV
ncbi:HK97 family phage prohead protease [Rhizobium herbae]|nr:HK97 family phage prohead protease [Rhizobium herbae]